MRPVGRGRRRRLAHHRGGLRPLVAATIERENAHARQALDRAQGIALRGVAERDRLAALAGARGAADAVDIGLGDVGQLEIDDMADVVDVDAARGDVGRHHGAGLAGAERRQGALALALALVAVNGERVDPGGVEAARHAIGAALGAGENDRAGERRIGEQLHQHVAFSRGVDVDDGLLDPFDGGRRRRHRDLGRLVQQFAGELADVGRHGGGKEQVLPLLRQFADDAADRLDEAEIEHLIDFVENEEFDRPEVGDARVEMVEQASRRRHQHVEALGQRPDLGARRHAAEDDGDVERQAGRKVAEALRDLAGEFARRRKHENARPAPRRRLLVGDEAVEDRQGEGGRLAGAGLGDADQVAALHQDGNGLRLDGRRLGVAHLGQRSDERRGEAEAVEILQNDDLSNSRYGAEKSRAAA